MLFLKKALSVVAVVSILATGIDAAEMTIGEVYPFAEDDLLVAIHQYIEQNKPMIKNKLKKIQKKMKDETINYKPEGLIDLSPAMRDRVFYPDLTYTLDRDITDAEGKILYKKGYSFNPLDYAHVSYGIVVINGDNRAEVEWLKKSPYLNTIAYRIFLSGGSYYELSKELNQTVYYCMPKITEKFKLQHTPSVIIQKGQKMEVTEVCLRCRKDGVLK